MAIEIHRSDYTSRLNPTATSTICSHFIDFVDRLLTVSVIFTLCSFIWLAFSVFLSFQIANEEENKRTWPTIRKHFFTQLKWKTNEQTNKQTILAPTVYLRHQECYYYSKCVIVYRAKSSQAKHHIECITVWMSVCSSICMSSMNLFVWEM